MSALRQRKGEAAIRGVDFDLVGQTVWINHGKIAVRISKNKEGGLTISHTVNGKWTVTAYVINGGVQE